MSERENFLGRAKIKIRTATLPDGSTIYIRTVPAGRAVDLYERSNGNGTTTNKDKMLTSIIEQVCDEHGQPIFNDTDEDREMILGLDSEYITAVCVAINPTKPETAAKNSEASPSVDSPTV